MQEVQSHNNWYSILCQSNHNYYNTTKNLSESVVVKKKTPSSRAWSAKRWATTKHVYDEGINQPCVTLSIHTYTYQLRTFLGLIVGAN